MTKVEKYVSKHKFTQQRKIVNVTAFNFVIGTLGIAFRLFNIRNLFWEIEAEGQALVKLARTHDSKNPKF